MSYRRALLGIVAGFLAYCLWLIIAKDTATSVGMGWPLVFGLLIVLMLPEKRLDGELFARIIEAMKGVRKDGP